MNQAANTKQHVGNGPDALAGQQREVRRVTCWGLAVNVLLSAVKFLFGILGSSQALVADAVHSLSDSITDIAVLIGVRFWTAPPDENHPYGHHRIETLITFMIGISLGLVAIGLAYRALATLGDQSLAPPTWLALAAAVLSITSKEWLYQWNAMVGRRVKSSALLANAWHHRADALSSVPVAVAVLAIQIWPTWQFLDQVATLIVGTLIIYAAWQISSPAFHQLVDTGASKKKREAILGIALDTRGVESVHALRTRHIGPGLYVDLHTVVDPDISVREGHEIAAAVKYRLLEKGPAVIDVVVHVEPE